MKSSLIIVSIISITLAVGTRYLLGKEASGDILMWLFVLAIISLAVGVLKD